MIDTFAIQMSNHPFGINNQRHAIMFIPPHTLPDRRTKPLPKIYPEVNATAASS